MTKPPNKKTRSLAAALWGVGGTVFLLVEAIYRLTLTAVEIVRREGIDTAHALIAAAWTVLIVYAEGYRAFQLRFSPRVVARALYLANNPRPLHVVLAPLFCMALIHTTRRRLIASWLLVAGIVGIILLVRLLPPIWRAIIDGGVVCALTWGTLVMIVYFVQGLAGRPMPVAADLPEEEAAPVAGRTRATPESRPAS